jgi:uncharacterized membrane protein YdjX (TVP38/TMEM64 family)
MPRQHAYRSQSDNNDGVAPQRRRRGHGLKIAGRVLLFAAVAAGIAVGITHRESFDAGALETWVTDFGVAAPIVFVAIYAVGTVFFMPGLLFTLAAGALFGAVWGAVYSLIGATAGATCAFLVARYLASEWVAERAGGRLKQVIEGVEQEGWRFVAMTRLIPFIPFTLLNYALGVTRIPLSHYVVASFVCMAPGAAAYAYLGFAGREAATGGESLVEKILIGLGVLAAIIFLPRLIKRLRRKKNADAA